MQVQAQQKYVHTLTQKMIPFSHMQIYQPRIKNLMQRLNSQIGRPYMFWPIDLPLFFKWPSVWFTQDWKGHSKVCNEAKYKCMVIWTKLLFSLIRCDFLKLFSIFPPQSLVKCFRVIFHFLFMDCFKTQFLSIWCFYFMNFLFFSLCFLLLFDGRFPFPCNTIGFRDLSCISGLLLFLLTTPQLRLLAYVRYSLISHLKKDYRWWIT